jgi:hypothetical protein
MEMERVYGIDLHEERGRERRGRCMEREIGSKRVGGSVERGRERDWEIVRHREGKGERNR